jgi:hypothetical protein
MEILNDTARTVQEFLLLQSGESLGPVVGQALITTSPACPMDCYTQVILFLRFVGTLKDSHDLPSA